MTANPLAAAHAASSRAARRWTVRALGTDLQPRNLLWQYSPGTAHILWLAGHIAWAQESLLTGFLGAPAVLPKERFSQFGIGSKPGPDATKYPSLETVIQELEASQANFDAALSTLADARLLEKTPAAHPASRMFDTIDTWLRLAPLPETYHAGQITLLRRSQGRPGGFGV